MRFIIKDTCRQKSKKPINASCVGHILTQCRRTKRCRLWAANVDTVALHSIFHFHFAPFGGLPQVAAVENVTLFFANNLKHT